MLSFSNKEFRRMEPSAHFEFFVKKKGQRLNAALFFIPNLKRLKLFYLHAGRPRSADPGPAPAYKIVLEGFHVVDNVQAGIRIAGI